MHSKVWHSPDHDMIVLFSYCILEPHARDECQSTDHSLQVNVPELWHITISHSWQVSGYFNYLYIIVQNGQNIGLLILPYEWGTFLFNCNIFASFFLANWSLFEYEIQTITSMLLEEEWHLILRITCNLVHPEKYWLVKWWTSWFRPTMNYPKILHQFTLCNCSSTFNWQLFGLLFESSKSTSNSCSTSAWFV